MSNSSNLNSTQKSALTESLTINGIPSSIISNVINCLNNHVGGDISNAITPTSPTTTTTKPTNTTTTDTSNTNQEETTSYFTGHAGGGNTSSTSLSGSGTPLISSGADIGSAIGNIATATIAGSAAKVAIGALAKLPVDPSAAWDDITNMPLTVAKDVMGTASQIISAGVGSLASALPSTVDAFSKTASQITDTGPLSSITNNVKEGTKETLTKVQTLAESEAQALSKAVSFKTKQVQDMIDTIDLPKVASDILDIPSKFGTDFLGSLASRVGLDSITDMSGLNDALGSVGKVFSDTISTATGVLNGVVGGVINTATGALSNIVPYISSGISSVVDSVGQALNIGGIFEDLGDIGNALGSAFNDVVDLLPDSLVDGLSNIGGALLDDAINGVNKYLNDTIQNLLDKIPGIDINDVLNSLNANGNSFSDYEQFGDMGSSFLGGNTTPDKDTIDGLYDAAASICPTAVDKPEITDERLNKDLYDALLSELSKLSLNDLMADLLGCSEYQDERSENILATKGTSNAVMNGDPFSYKTIVDHIGTSKIVDPELDALFLNANMSLNSKNATDKKDTYYTLLKETNLTIEQLIASDQFSDIDSYDAPKIIVMSNSNTTVIDEHIGEVDRLLAESLMRAYA